MVETLEPKTHEEITPDAPEPEPQVDDAVPKQREIYKVVILNREDDVMKRAAKLTEDALHARQHGEHIRESKKVKRAVKKGANYVWYRYGEEFHRQKGIKRARERMIAEDNPYLQMDPLGKNGRFEDRGRTESVEAAAAKIEQVLEFQDEAGELRQQKTEIVSGKVKTLIVNELIRPVVEGSVSTYKAMQDLLGNLIKKYGKEYRVLEEYFGRNASEFKRHAEYFATDLLDKGTKIKDDLQEQGKDLAQVQDQIEIHVAKTDWAADTKAQLSKADTYVGWAKPIFNETVIGAGVSLAVLVGKRGGSKALWAVGAGMAAGGAVAAYERSRSLKIDRQAHMRDLEYGIETPVHAKQRKELDKYKYRQVVSAQDLLEGRRDLSSQDGDQRGILALSAQDTLTVQERALLVDRIAEIRERLRFSREEGVGYIKLDELRIEQERLALQRAVKEGKHKLFTAYETDGGKEVAMREIEIAMEKWRKRFGKDQSEQDRKFNEYKRKETGKFAGIGIISALVGATAIGAATKIASEAFYWGEGIVIKTPVFRDMFGPVLGMPGKEELEKMLQQNVVPPSSGKSASLPQGETIVRQGNVEIKLSKGLTVVKRQDGTFSVVSEKNASVVYAKDVKIDTKTGEIAGFDEKGSKLKTLPDLVKKTIRKRQRVFGHGGILDRHGSKIDGQQFYANNTPGVSDGNEGGFHTYKRGDEIILSMNEMKWSEESGLQPSHVYVPEEYQRDRGAFAFFLDGRKDKPLVVTANSDGYRSLNPKDHDPDHFIRFADGSKMQRGRFSRLVLNSKAYAHLPDGDIATESNGLEDTFKLAGRDGTGAGHISAGRLVERNGQQVWQSFATIHGTGRTPEHVVQHAKQYILDLKIPGEKPAPPVPPAHPSEGAILDQILAHRTKMGVVALATPWTPRKPLETLREKPATAAQGRPDADAARTGRKPERRKIQDILNPEKSWDTIQKETVAKINRTTNTQLRQVKKREAIVIAKRLFRSQEKGSFMDSYKEISREEIAELFMAMVLGHNNVKRSRFLEEVGKIPEEIKERVEAAVRTQNNISSDAKISEQNSERINQISHFIFTELQKYTDDEEKQRRKEYLLTNLPLLIHMNSQFKDRSRRR